MHTSERCQEISRRRNFRRPVRTAWIGTGPPPSLARGADPGSARGPPRSVFMSLSVRRRPGGGRPRGGRATH
eukprot:8324144-Pyramimonas_sp.AAC.1